MSGANGGSLREAGSPGEWLIGGLSLLAVLAIAVLLVHQDLTDSGQGPAVQVRVDSIRAAEDSVWVVAFTAENTGGAPAMNVLIEGTLGPRAAPLETSRVSLHLLPEGSRRSGGLQFSMDPANDTLRLRATGWIRP